jgi:5'-3' exoribonuclease 2
MSCSLLIQSVFFLTCKHIGNDFLPHLPSLDIRDGALDFLFNVYKRVLPTLGDYITNHGGEVNLSHVDVILAEVGAIEDYVFQMKHHNEEGEKRRKEQTQERKKYLTRNGQAPLANPPGGTIVDDVPKVKGRAARVLDSSTDMTALGKHGKADVSNHNSLEENAMVAEQLKASLRKEEKAAENISTKRKAEDISKEDSSDVKSCEEEINDVEEVEDSVLETETSLDYEEEEDIEEEIDQAKLDEATALLKKKLKEVEQQKLNDYAAKVEDKVRLHEKGWKVSIYDWLYHI